MEAKITPIGYYDKIEELDFGQISEEIVEELYDVVLVDSPIGPYFLRFMQACVDEAKEEGGDSNVD